MFTIDDKVKIGSFNKAMYKDIFEKVGSENARTIGFTYEELHNTGIMTLKLTPIPMYNNTISLGFETELTKNDTTDIINEFESNAINYYGLGFANEVTKPSTLPTTLEKEMGLMKRYSVIMYLHSMDIIPENGHSFQIKEISASAESYFKIAKSGFGIPDDHDDQFKAMNKYFYGDTTRRSFIVLKNNIPITAGQLYYNENFKIGWLGNVVTSAENRNQGGQTALIKHRLKILQDLGCEKVVTETFAEEKQSSHNLKKLGFTELFTTDYYLKKN